MKTPFLLLLLGLCFKLWAQSPSTMDSLAPKTDSLQNTEDTVLYSADQIEFVRKDSLLILLGHAELKNKTVTLKADTIYYRTDIKQLEAVGKPILTDQGDIVCGERMVYLLNEKRGKIDYGTTHSQENVYNGEAIARMSDESFLVQNGDFSTCSNDSNPHYYFFSKRMKVMPKNKAIVRPVVLNIGDVPVGILPYFVFPIHHGRQSGLLTPRWGQFSENGNMNSYLNNVGYYFALSDYTDLETKMDFSNGEGFFFKRVYFNSIFNYNKRYLLNGYLNARMETSRSDETSSKNYALSYSHNQNLLPDGSFYLRGSGEIAGNSNYYRQSSLERTDYLKRELTSNMALVKNFKEAGVSINADVSYRQNLDTKENSLRAPSFNLNTGTHSLPFVARYDDEGIPLPIDSLPWYGKFNWGYNASGIHTRDTRLIRRFSVLDSLSDTATSLTSYEAMDLRHNFSFGLLQNPTLGYINIIPRFGLSDNWFFKEKRKRGILRIDTNRYSGSKFVDTIYQYDTVSAFNRRAEWSTGLDLNTKLYGISRLNWGRLIGFRHTLSPGISYTFSPELKGGEKFVTAGTTNNSDRDQQQTIGFGLSNLFQSKLAGDPSNKESREQTINLLNLDANTSYNFMAKNRAGQVTGKWGDISTRAGTNLYTLDLSYNGRHSFYDDNDEFIPLRKNAKLPNRLPRLMSYDLSASTGTRLSGKFNGGTIKAEPSNKPTDSKEVPGMNPWNLGLNFSYNYRGSYNTYFKIFETSSTFSLRDNLTLNFTDNWSLTYSSMYDFKSNELVDQSMNLAHDFHCWQAVFNWVMNGYRSGFYFRIGVKDLPDIKFEQRGGQYGNYYGGMSFPGQSFLSGY